MVSLAGSWMQARGGHTAKLTARTGVELCTSLLSGLGDYILGFQVKHKQLHVIIFWSEG